MTLDLAEFPSPIGKIMLATRDGALCALEFRERWPHRHPRLTERFGTLDYRSRDPTGMCNRLAAYFGGDLHAFDGVALDAGGTPFQQRVWAALCEIPIASDGRLSGYAGGVHRKRWLLEHERAGTGDQKNLPL